MAVAALSCFAIEKVEQRSSAAQLRERATAVASALERRANANAAYLRAGAALFATLDEVPPARFRRFVSELRLDADYGGSPDGIGWAERIDRSAIPEFNARLARDYGAGVQMHPTLAAGQQFAVPVEFLEPDSERNRRAIGFDMFSEPTRRAAMMEAQRVARPVASGQVVLMQEGPGKRRGFLIYMPVFQAAPDGAHLKGFVYSAINAEDFLASAMRSESIDDVQVKIFDGSVSADHLLATSKPVVQGGATVTETLAIANHPWVIAVSVAKGEGLSPLSIATLLFGFAAAGLLALVASIMTQQANEDSARLSWFEEQNAIRDSLTRELNHRVKNTLANVLSIVALTRRRATSLDDFAEGLDGRIRALSATHDLLTQSDWGPTPMSAVIEAELAPYARDTGPLIQLDGPMIELAPTDALSLGLAIHELATNAAKHGSLSQPSGRLSVKWQMLDGDRALIEWEESGGPPVPAPGQRGRGFGMDLIERIVAQELQHPVKMDFAPEGLRCSLTIPIRMPRPFAIRRRD